MASAGTFTVNRGAIRAAISVPSSAPYRDLVRRGDRVVALAKFFCPVDTGRLRSTIGRTDPRPTAIGLSLTIFADTDYAAAIHEGRGSPYAPPSWHSRGPGPRRFLTNALSAAGGQIGR
jgi:hypothetical protein